MTGGKCVCSQSGLASGHRCSAKLLGVAHLLSGVVKCQDGTQPIAQAFEEGGFGCSLEHDGEVRQCDVLACPLAAIHGQLTTYTYVRPLTGPIVYVPPCSPALRPAHAPAADVSLPAIRRAKGEVAKACMVTHEQSNGRSVGLPLMCGVYDVGLSAFSPPLTYPGDARLADCGGRSRGSSLALGGSRAGVMMLVSCKS